MSLTRDERLLLQVAQQALLHAHKAILEEERRRYELAHGRVPSAMAFLQLLLNDPWFAWIRPISGLAAQMDEALFAKPGEFAIPVGTLLEEARFLLTPREDGDELPRRYFQMIQSSAAVATAHAEALKVWPQS
jgi:hypothetical protein